MATSAFAFHQQQPVSSSGAFPAQIYLPPFAAGHAVSVAADAAEVRGGA